ncbi:S41 family peptidase [Chitinophaga sp. Cy-1792]|uniref:S41 family peptidase n=1 Tax=Chitinophaga sp. Cy-1792 TaxID=2608339 RepID=UPI00141FE05D|nr:S41 family peptidase [Chitinophaga sp. Cy-1792]NIG54990.1 peptidase S41 [Chitinophaga sp. Cy-1792]
MKSRICLFVMTLLLAAQPGYTQSCNCESNFKWMKKTFEENDAGFSYVLDKKGKDAYEVHNQQILKRVKAAKSNEACLAVMTDWLRFFRKGHSYVRLTKPAPAAKPVSPATWEMQSVDTVKFKEQLSLSKQPGFEGIWHTGVYSIAIIRKGDQYIGSIVSAEAPTWKPGMVKLRINTAKDTLNSVYYMRDFSAVTSNKVMTLGRNYLQLGSTILKRTYPENFKDDAVITEYCNSLGASVPFLVKRNDNTFYLRIPSFDRSNLGIIDSLMKANKQELVKTRNLIVDIRGNGGGSDATYGPLFPFLYTNPIRGVGVEYYSTKLNNQRMLDFINKPEYGFGAEEKAWAKKAYDKLEEHLGEFVNLNGRIVSVDTLPEKYPNPQQVAIIIDENNGSTAEQFLLEAKQSRKVKLYGVTTFGVLDISNMYEQVSPCKDITLGYCLTRSLRIPDFTIDAKGIQPDYYIDRSIPSYEWVNFVNGLMND